MRRVYITLIILFLSASSGVSTRVEARQHCGHHRECHQMQLAKFQEANGLPPRIIGKIQRKFQGRVVGVRPISSDCREIEKNVTIRGKKRVIQDFACRKPDGSWGAPLYQVQVLVRGGKVLIITVNSRSGHTISVQE